MKRTLVDRTIALAFPQLAAKNMIARARMNALEALPDLGSMSALDDGAHPNAPGAGPMAPSDGAGRWWRPRARDARSDTMRQLPLQRGQSRDLARTSPIAVGAINTNVDRVVGTGLALSAQPNIAVLGWTPEQARAWKTKVQTEFAMWADSTESDIEETLNFYQQQGLVFRSVLESGDCATILPDGKRSATQPYALRLQVIEADRIGNENGVADTLTTSGGVKLGPGGAPQSYFVYDNHPGGFLPGQKGSIYKGGWYDRIGRSGRRRILHHFRKLRPGQPRGLPYLAPIVGCVKQISRYTEAEIMAAVISAYVTVFIETPTGESAPVFDGTTPGAGTAGAEIGLGPGAVVGLGPGEKATTTNPTRPNPNFEPFILAIIKQIGMALSLPYELLLKQFNSSYSASKAAMLDAWIYFRSVRNWLALSFCQPIYETWLTEAVALGRIAAPGFFADPLLRWAYTRAAWPGDSMGSINPKDEVAAYTDAIEARLMTRERAEWELFGTDWNDTQTQRKAEHDRLIQDDMLPVPKAGAAAPQPVKEETP